MKASRWIRGIALSTISVCLWSQAGASPGYTGAEDAAAASAAEEALKVLGPNRGAISFAGSSVDIIGLESVRVSGVTAEIEKAMKDLGARKLETEIQVSLPGDVLFAFDKWDIKPEAEATLRKVATLIRELHKRRVIIEGHTDAKGSDAYNQTLSLKRANAVKDWLTEKADIKSVQFEVGGYGETRPVSPNTKPDGSDNPEGRAANRRVEIRILRQQ